MSKITPHMISAAYDAYFNANKTIAPVVEAGMSESSAKMTMVWFDHIFSGTLYKRTGSAMQIEWVLNKLVEEGDKERLAMVLKSLRLYVDFYSDKPMNKVRALVDEYQEASVNISLLAETPMIGLTDIPKQSMVKWRVISAVALLIVATATATMYLVQDKRDPPTAGHSSWEGATDTTDLKELRNVALHGDVSAQIKLAEKHFNGDGVEQDYVEAFKWYHHAALNGYSDAQYRVALMYDGGLGVGRDRDEAAKWYRKAAM